MRVALADDSALFRRGLAVLLETAGVEVTVEARDGVELVAAVAADPPDVAVLDIRMPPTFTDEGLVVASTLVAAHPEMGLLLLSTHAQTDYATRLLALDRRGVGYLLKDRVDDIATLVDALHRIVCGESVIDPQIVTTLFARRRRSPSLDDLTERESDVLRLMAEGRSNAGIAGHLHLGTKTVESYVASVFAKLGLYAGISDNRRVLAVLTWMKASGTTQ